MLQMISSGRLKGEYYRFSEIFFCSQILYEPLVKKGSREMYNYENQSKVCHS